MKRAALIAACAVIALGMGAVVSSAGADEPVLRFRGAGKTRDALNAMQLKPFDQSLWSRLSDWKPEAPKGDETTGKVVLIVTWSSWYPISHGTMRAAQSLYEKHKGSGLVVVGVHNPRMPEGAAENAKTMGIAFPWAQDKDGKFREALYADQDPNIYVIDRAGNMRYAQIEKSSMETAVDHLLSETPEIAKAYPALVEKQRMDAEKTKWTTKDASGVKPGEHMEVPFADPEDEAYAKTKWPYFVGKVEQDKILEKITNTPPKIELAEEGWIPSAPKTHGKIVVLYLVDPKEVSMLPIVPIMNRLQDRYKRDVVVLCNAAKLGEKFVNVQGEEAAKLTERNVALLKSLLGTRNVNHYLQPSPIKGEQIDFGTNGGGSGDGIPLYGTGMSDAGTAMVISTDKKVRWIGHSYSQDLPLALDALIKVDPAVQARRKAEEAKAKSR